MKPTLSLASLAACMALLLPVAASAAGPQLNIPDFSHLQDKAIDSVDITIDGVMLAIAKRFAASAEDDEEVTRILSNIKSVRVRTFEFDTDNVYSRADIEGVRKQLVAPGWSALIQAHKREPQEDVDVYLNTDDGKIKGLAVVASEPRSFVIVNIIGNIDIEQLAWIEGQLGIPKLSTTE